MIDALQAIPLSWWLALSVALYVAATNLSWRVSGWTAGRGSRIGAAVRWCAASPLTALGSLAYNIGAPCAAIAVGLLDPQQMGLVQVDWLNSLVAGAAMLGAAGLLLWLDRVYLGRLLTEPLDGSLSDVPAASAISTVWDVAFLQAHLGFYRGVAITLVGAYAGALAGLGLVLLEWGLNPAWRLQWSKRGLARPAFDLFMALTTTVLFLYTGNLWVCAAVHCILALSLRGPGRAVTDRPEQDAPPAS